METVIYRVIVHNLSTGKLIDATTFPVGEWKEIGYWLDNAGYIEPGYKVTITVHPA